MTASNFDDKRISLAAREPWQISTSIESRSSVGRRISTTSRSRLSSNDSSVMAILIVTVGHADLKVTEVPRKWDESRLRTGANPLFPQGFRHWVVAIFCWKVWPGNRTLLRA